MQALTPRIGTLLREPDLLARSPLPRCAWCAQPGAMLAEGADKASCAHCHIALHLERPRIDDEAVLVWLPELDQRAINVLCRELAVQLRAVGALLHATPSGRPSPEVSTLRASFDALARRAGAAAARLGTDRPSDLADALRAMPPGLGDRQGERLGGLRVLPLGRFHAAGKDVYPGILDAWSPSARKSASPPARKAA